MSNQLQKAHLEVESGGRIDCMFNPTTFAFATQNRWESDQIPGKSTPTLRFAGGAGGTFSLSLVFDTTGTGKAVTEHTNKLLKLMEVDTTLAGYDEAKNNGRPPWVKFHWGTHVHSFKAVITSTNVTFTYFSNPTRTGVRRTRRRGPRSRSEPIRCRWATRSIGSPRATTATRPSGVTSPP